MRRLFAIAADFAMLMAIALLAPLAILLLGLPIAGAVKVVSAIIAKAVGGGV